MYPVLINIGSFPVSSFGLLLALGIFFGGFTIWRIGRGYEFNAEKLLDLIFLTAGVGLVFSRVVYVLMNLSVFDSIQKILFLNRYPGLSFWGGLYGGLWALHWLCRRNKLNFFQLGDFAIVGFFLTAFFAQIGCFLGGCSVGVASNFLGVDQAGFIGKRFPIQIIEALVFLFIFIRLWKSSLKFHIEGSLLAKGLIILGVIKLVTEFFRQPQLTQIFRYSVNLNLIFAGATILLGFWFYYKATKKTPSQDIAGFFRFFTNSKTRSQVLVNIRKGWYNHWVNLRIGLNRGKKRLFKMLNIKPNPESF